MNQPPNNERNPEAAFAPSTRAPVESQEPQTATVPSAHALSLAPDNTHDASSPSSPHDVESDETFEREQAHLTETYAKLEHIAGALSEKLAKSRARASAEIAELAGDMTYDFDSDDVSVETAAEYETLNLVINSYNSEDSILKRRLSRARLLLEQPYFAELVLQFKKGEQPKRVYLGAAGMTDDNRRHFIIDWRSPIAEVYYNQATGPTAYRVEDRTIEVDLKLRRQFDITRDRLRGYFDTTVAIEDPLLLKSLSEQRSEKLQAITATIQKEQNQVVRHADVPVLVVNGIAGSGKTSVLLQRIAYLFYRKRASLEPRQVRLLTPNPVFGKYIDAVLPNMGESNPQIFTWNDFMENLGLRDEGGAGTPAENLAALEDGLANLTVEFEDLCEVSCAGDLLLKHSQVRATLEKYRRIPAGPHLTGLVNEELTARVERKIKQMAQTERVHEALYDLDVDEQVRLFGDRIGEAGEDELRSLAERYLNDRYAGVWDRIEGGCWLNVNRIGKRMLNKQDLSTIERLYLRLLLTGEGAEDARFVMVDEVQDYTAAQLMVLALYFKRAHFLLLGDEHQAIKPHTATFPQILRIFTKTHGSVEECRLLTSYRSTPEITRLFCGLLPPRERVQASSVQRAGTEPIIEAHQTRDGYARALTAAVARAHEDGGLAAVITRDRARARATARLVGNDAVLMRNDTPLPSSGVIVLDVPLAKGLEFDQVIIPDAEQDVYDESPLARRCLYTALSRATRKVCVLAHGNLTSLLANEA